MTIKTGFILVVGIGIGTLIGMTVTEDTKKKIANKMISAITGEDRQINKPQVKTNYTAYSMPKAKKYGEWRWEDLLICRTKDEAKLRFKQIKDFANTFGSISICDLCSMYGRHADYTWDNYGWMAEDLWNEAYVEGNEVIMPRPIVLGYNRKNTAQKIKEEDI